MNCKVAVKVKLQLEKLLTLLLASGNTFSCHCFLKTLLRAREPFHYFQARYCHAVWKEGSKDVNENIPVRWLDISNNKVKWPKDSSKPIGELIRQCCKPGNGWRSFPLKKVKRFSGRFVTQTNQME